MRAIDHYRQAESDMVLADEMPTDGGGPYFLARAQIHATLALAGATALQAYSRGDEPELDEWAEMAGGDT